MSNLPRLFELQACNLYSLYFLNYIFGGFGGEEPDDICYYL